MTIDKRSTLVDQDYQIAGNSIWRQMKHWFHMKTAIMGYYDTGPGLRNLIILWVLHHFGKPIFWLRSKLAQRHALKHKIKSLLIRGQRVNK